jgi:predicted Zn-dependent protease
VQLFAELVEQWKAFNIAPSTILEYVLPVARCAEPDSVLWDILEHFGPQTDNAEQVVAAYGAAVAFFKEPAILERLGQRMVAFAEQWAPDASAFAEALLRILEVAPRARWALDRVTFVFSQQGRFGELLDWFDRAIAAEESAEVRHALLDEAIVTARDLAKDNDRAIAYLERQCAERPDDAKAQASLERLYRRGGYTRKLIDLLTRRLESLADPERAQVQAHIATRWLELGEPEQALQVTESILERRPSDTSALELLERIVDSPPDEGASFAAQASAAKYLIEHYTRLEQYTEAVRVLESELRFALKPSERTAVLHSLADFRANQLNDLVGAFRILVELVALEPTLTRNRLELEELAERLSQYREYAEALARIALDLRDPRVSLPLLTDALRVYATKLDDPERESQLHEQLLAWTQDERVILRALAALDGLYSKLDDPANLCRVLEMRAEREQEVEIQLYAWRGAARLALTALDESQRAVTDWRHVLSLAPKDREALDGLVESLGRLGDSPALIDALELRAAQGEGQPARSDLVRAAKLAESLDHTTRALALWQRVANRFGDDQESALAIADLLEKEERWLELRDHLHEYSLSVDDAERRSILVRAARVELERMNDAPAAVSSYAKAQVWHEAVAVVENTADVAERTKVALGLIDLADTAWKAGDAQAEPIYFQAILIHARCSLPTIESMRDTTTDLAQSTKLLRRATQARDRLIAATERPFARERKRALLLEAARVTLGWLREPLEAIRLFASLFSEDPIDPIAEQSFAEYSELLQSQGLWSDLAELVEHRAKAAPDGSPRAISAWLKAGDIWENKANDPARALAAHRYAADSDSIPALEAVARLARQLDHAAEAARALEQLVAHAGSRAPVERVIELVDAYLASGDLGRARLRLESTLQAGWHSEVDQRLESLYRRIQQWSELVSLFKMRAARQEDASARIDLLREAAALQKSRLNDNTAAASTLTEALDLDPERNELQLELARTCATAGQYDRAVALLEKLIEAFGQRRSRARAELHTELSSVLEAMGQSQRAFEELKLAASIDQAQPRVLYALGKSALLHKAYDLAEQTLSSLLLLLHRSGGEVQGIGQAHAYLVLSDVATQSGDTVRARDYIESAFETALESPEHERRLLAALVELDRPALIQRALELRWSHVTDPIERCALLRDRLEIPTLPQEAHATKEKLERRARETWARLNESTPAVAFRNLAEVFDWLGDTAAATQALNTFADRVDWAKATPEDAAALLRLAHRELSEGLDFALAHRHIEASLRLGIPMPELASTVDLILSIADTQFAPIEHRFAAMGLARGLVEAVSVTAPATDPALGASLLLKLGAMAERLGFDDVIDRAVTAAASLDPNRDVLFAQLKRLRVSNPESPERWELAEQLLAVESGPSALDLGLEIARHAREHQERARAARALSKVVAYVQSGAGLALDVVELLAWSGLPQRAMDLIEASPNAWTTDNELVTKVAYAIDDGVRNLELEDRLVVELRWIDWLIAHDQTDSAHGRLSTLAAEMSDSPVVLERLAHLAVRQGHADEAIKTRIQLLNLASETEKPLRVCEFYDTCEQLNRPSAARAELEQAHRIYPGDRELTKRLTRLYEKIDAPAELAELLLSTTSDLGDDELATDNLVRAARLVLTKSPAEARDFLERAEQLRPNAPAELELARLHAVSGDIDKAIEFYTLATESAEARYAQERASANYELGQLHLKVDRLVEAHEALNAAFRFRPKNAEIALQVAQLAIDLSDDDVAKRALRVLVSLKSGPKDGDDSVSSQTKSKAFYYLGRMLNGQGDSAGARRMLSRALEEDSNNESARLLHDRLA